MRPSRFPPARLHGFTSLPRSWTSRPALTRILTAAPTLTTRPASTRRADLPPASSTAAASSRSDPRAQPVAALNAFPAWSTSPVNTGNPFYQDDFPSSPPNCPTPDSAQHIGDLLAPSALWTTSPVNTGDVYSSHLLDCSARGPTPDSELASPAMASDDDYAAFLDKASADRAGSASTQSRSAAPKAAQHTRLTTSSVPHPLQNVKATYTSDADEPFEPVSLKRSGPTGSLTAKEVKQLIGATADVTEITVADFDPKGDYKHVIDAVEQAVGKRGCARVFKVAAGGARVEYWILEVAQEPNNVVGMKATSVES